MDHHLHHHQPPQHHHQHHQQQPSYYPTQMIATPNSYPTQTQQTRFPFSSPPLVPTSPTTHSGGSGQQKLDSSGFGGIDPSSQKKKRGRPRKYSPDSGGGGVGGGGNIALGLSPTAPMSMSMSNSGVMSGGSAAADSGGTGENASKRNRGRPAGSSKRQLDALGNCGVGFTPHVILVNAGEDIAAKIVAFSKQGPRTVCVLSANGSICDVDLRQPANAGGVVKYEGRFEIISLSGSFLFSENSGGQVRTGGLSVSLAGTDGRVMGGGVAGMLRAATPVQIIVGSFIADGKKVKYMPSVPQSHMLSFAAPPLPAADSPPSQDVSTEGSDENGSNHIDRTMGSYGNSNHPIHHNMQMYPQMGWPNSGTKILPS